MYKLAEHSVSSVGDAAHCSLLTVLTVDTALILWAPTTMPTSYSHQLRPSGDNHRVPLVMMHTVTNTREVLMGEGNQQPPLC